MELGGSENGIPAIKNNNRCETIGIFQWNAWSYEEKGKEIGYKEVLETWQRNLNFSMLI